MWAGCRGRKREGARKHTSEDPDFPVRHLFDKATTKKVQLRFPSWSIFVFSYQEISSLLASGTRSRKSVRSWVGMPSSIHSSRCPCVGATSAVKKERPRLPVRHPSDDPARRAAAILAYRIETKFTFTLDLSRWCRSLGELLVFAFVCRIGNQISGVRPVGLHFHWISLDVLSSFVGFAGLGICRSTPPCTASVP